MAVFLRFVSPAWLFGLLTGLTLALHAPLLMHFGSAIPADLGDPLLNTWILWWNTQRIPLTDAYWHAPSFAPAPYALALSETLLGLTWLTTPLQWMGATPLVAYNAMFVAIPVLNGLSAYWLCLILTGRRDAALIGCLALAFAPYHANQLSHLQTQAMFFMPIALVGLHRYFQSGERKWVVLFGAAVAANGLVCGYFLLYFAVLLALAIPWLAISTGDPKKLLPVALALAAAALMIAPVALTYRSTRAAFDLKRSVVEVEAFSAEVASFARGSNRLLLWPIATAPDHPEEAEYPGVVIGLLVIAGAIAAARSRQRDSAPTARWRKVAVIVLVCGSALALSIGVIDWLSGSPHRPYKPIGVAMDLAIMAALVSARFWALVRSGSIAGLYAVGAIVVAMLTLGPVGRIFGHRFWYKPPYSWLMPIPGMDSARVPALFSSIEVLCLSVLAAFAITRLVPRPSRTSYAATALLAAAIVLDGWAVVPVVKVPGAVPVALSADLVVELPTRGWVENAAAMYRGTVHKRRVMNGYSGYMPPHYPQLQHHLRNYCVRSLDAVRDGRSLDVVVWRADVDAEIIDAALRAQWSSVPREETPEVIVYRVPRSRDNIPELDQEPPIDLRTLCPSAGR